MEITLSHTHTYAGAIFHPLAAMIVLLGVIGVSFGGRLRAMENNYLPHRAA